MPKDTEHIDNTNRHFHGQQKAEKVIIFTRKHPIVLLRVVLITSLIYASTIMVLLFIPLNKIEENILIQTILFLLVIMMTISHHTFFMRLLNFYLDIVIITNYRVIDMRKSIFLHDDKEIIDLHEIQDTKKRQKGIFANFLNYGDLEIVIPSMTASMHLPHIPKPEYYLHQINETKRMYILERRQQKAETQESTASPTTLRPMSYQGVQRGPKPNFID